MIVARILVGDCTKGNTAFFCLPTCFGNTEVFYNSCMNNLL